MIMVIYNKHFGVLVVLVVVVVVVLLVVELGLMVELVLVRSTAE